MRPGDPGKAWGGRQGSEFSITAHVKVAGIPVPLAGYGVEFRMRRWFDTAGDPLLAFTRDDPAIVVDDDAAEIVLTITAPEMRSLPSTLGIAPYEAELILIPAGDADLAFALLAGPFPVDPEVVVIDDGS